MNCARTLLSMFLAVAVSLPLMAQEKKEVKKATKADPAGAAFALPKEIELTADQKAKLEDLKKEYSAKLTEAIAKRDAVLTAEQKKAQAEARKAAKDSGKKGKEAKASIDAAAKLTDEQKKQLADADKAVADLQKTINTKKMDLLTAEQKAKIEAAKKKKETK